MYIVTLDNGESICTNGQDEIYTYDTIEEAQKWMDDGFGKSQINMGAAIEEVTEYQVEQWEAEWQEVEVQ